MVPFDSPESNILPKERITLGMGVICQARHVVIIIVGQDKRDVVKKMLKADKTLPIVRVVKHPVKKRLFLDRDVRSVNFVAT